MDNSSNQANQIHLPDNRQQQQHPLVGTIILIKSISYKFSFIKANYQFSPEEMRAIKQCDVEALLQRSLPIGTGFGLAAYYAVRGGYLKVKYFMLCFV